MATKSISIKDLGENNTMSLLEVHTGFMIPKDEGNLTHYFFDVVSAIKYIEDKLNLNAMGTDILLGLMLYTREKNIDLRDIDLENEDQLCKLAEDFLKLMKEEKSNG